MRIEDIIFHSLLSNEQYCRVVVPFLKEDLFPDRVDAVLVGEACKFFSTHNSSPTKEVIAVELRNRTGISDRELTLAEERLAQSVESVPTDWLIAQTESFCKKRSLYNAIVESISIIDGKSKDRKEETIPQLLQDALAVSFDTQIGHAYIADAEKRYDYYNAVEDRIQFGLTEMDKITGGGMVKKAIYCTAATSGGGKSIFLVNSSVSALRQGKNVLYITMEMSEERIGERVDANMMNIEIDRVAEMKKDQFMDKIDKISKKTRGKLYIKEYSAGAAHSGHFRALVEELKTKQNFFPDLIVIDYLGICASARVKMGGSVNTYSYYKSVAEELRGLAVEYNVPVLSALQLNRNSYNNTDIDMSNTAESMGIANTLDFYFALISTEELTELDQVLVQVLKNRYGPTNRFALGLKKAKMMFYDLEQAAQKSFTPAIPKTSAKGEAKVGAMDQPLEFGRKRTLDSSDFQF